MNWLDLTLIKRQCRIDLDFHDEDEILTLYGESVENQVLTDTGRTVEELKAYNVADPTKMPPNIVHASLLLVDFAYQQRSTVDKMQWYDLPYGYERLIKNYIRLADTPKKEE